MRVLKTVALVFAIMLMAVMAATIGVLALQVQSVGASGGICSTGGGNDRQECFRKHASQVRNDTYSEALSQITTPHPHNFPMRRLLSDLTQRQSLGHHPWYVYQLGMNGNVVRYFVSKSYPVNSCDYLETTQNVVWDSDGGNFLTQLPPLEGVYQSNNDDCSTYVFEDQITSAIVTVPIAQANVSDRPMLIHTKPVAFKAVKK